MTSKANLADLIRQHRESTGESYAMIAQRANLSVATVRELATKTHPRMPQGKTLDKLAEALGQPPLHIRLAALRSAGSWNTRRGELRYEILAAALKGLSSQDVAAAAVVPPGPSGSAELRHC